MTTAAGRRVVVVLKGYPRLSETFIAQELRGLEEAGLDLVLVSLRAPTDTKRHAVHDEIAAPVVYLPEYLYQEPLRVLRGLAAALRRPGFGAVLRGFLRDLWRDPTPNRVRRLGQAAVLAAEWPEGAGWLHAHFIHTPASVADYAARLLRLPYSISAHAKDIWTSPDWQLAEKLSRAAWTVTCTGTGHRHLQALAADPSRVHLSYHGLNLDRFPALAEPRALRDGSDPGDPVRIVSVGRAVPKKGYDVLLRALALNGQFMDHAALVALCGDADKSEKINKARIEVLISRLRAKLAPHVAGGSDIRAVRGRGYQLGFLVTVKYLNSFR